MKNNKKSAALLLGIVLVLAVCVFASCTSNKVTLTEYNGDDMFFMGKLVKLMHGWIGNYGWTVVVFTVFLKILMLPIDFWQRTAMRKNAIKMQRMQPLLEEIDKRYGANSERAQQEKQKIYQKQGASIGGSCLPMLVSMAIFFVMFAGLNSYSTYCNVKNFQDLYGTYHQTYVAQMTAEEKAEYDGYLEELKTDKNAEVTALSKFAANHKEQNAEYNKTALDAIPEYYENNHESWLWIHSVWQPDTWAPIMQPYSEFNNTVSLAGFGSDDGMLIYNSIREKVLETHSGWNGLMILPIMSVGLSFLSIFISQRLERKNRKGEQPAANDQQAMSNRMMMIMMPLMMAFFGFRYTGAFAIYMVCNYMLSIVSTIALRVPVEKAAEKSLAKQDAKNKTGKASYMR